jgi:glyoxylase-like metal-dependent hydrolase (beta-lactamase superfamily II)
MLSGAGANIAVQVGSDGVLIVDSGQRDMANAVIVALRQLTPAPLQMIINSTGDADHTGGNEAVARAGRRLTSTLGAGGGATVGAAIIARQAVMDRMIKEKAPDCALPTTTYDIYPTRSLYFNDEGIELRHVAAAHSDGDSLVFFRRSDVVSVGEIFNTNLYPFIDIEHGGSWTALSQALNELLEITIPALKQEGGTYVIPGRGRLADEADVSEYRDTVTIVRDRVRALIARKMTLEQVQAERPTLDYDGRYGGDRRTVDTGPLRRGGLPEPEPDGRRRDTSRGRSEAMKTLSRDLIRAVGAVALAVGLSAVCGDRVVPRLERRRVRRQAAVGAAAAV